MKTESGAPRHWLAELAQRRGIANVEGLELAPGTEIEEAWKKVADAAGIGEEELAGHVASHYRLDLANLDAYQATALRLVPESLAKRHRLFPLHEDYHHLVVATSDPTDIEAEQALGFVAGRAPIFQIATPGALRERIDAHYSADDVVEGLLEGVGEDVDGSVYVVEEAEPEAVAAYEAESAPVVNLTNLILRDAVRNRASDVHIEPGRAGGTVRFRVDGVLRHYMKLPMPAMNRTISRIKVMSGLDIADRIRPQDGSVRIRVDDRVYDLRVSTVPTRDSEKAVIRVLDPAGTKGLDDISMPAGEIERLRRLLTHREGIIIVTGPTGSGKTTTLYSALSELATGDVNIMTVEDPVEYELPSITQIQVEPRRGVTFASALRAILRQDPDIIFVGEIRDLETAEVAVQAAMTGHLVLATLHTNDSVSTVTRLADIGLERYAIAATLRGALAQRLVRRVCAHCAETVDGDLSEEERRLAKLYGVKPSVRAAGCQRCGRTGYRGRVPVAEVMVVNSTMEQRIGEGATVKELERTATAAGMRPIREVALDRVRKGETTLEELDRVLGEGAAEESSPETAQPHVLLADDDRATRLLARNLLEKNNFQISEACDGAEALELIASGEDYSLMVLDLNMPKVEGSEVLTKVRSSVATAGLPVIVLTSEDDTELEARLMEQGADDYIRKPIDPPRFLARVNAVLRRAAS